MDLVIVGPPLPVQVVHELDPFPSSSWTRSRPRAVVLNANVFTLSVDVLPAGPPPPLQASQLLLRRRLRWTSLRLDLNVIFEMFLDLEMILSPETFLDPVMILVPRWTSSTIGPIYVAVECRWTASPKTRIAATAS